MKEETNQGIRKHNVETPKTMAIGKFSPRINTPQTDVTYKGKTATLDKHGNLIFPEQKPTYTPMNPLADQGIVVIDGMPYEAIAYSLINNSEGPELGVKIRGKRLENNFDGEIFVPTMEQEPYNNQLRIDHAKFKFPAGEYKCIFEVTHAVTDEQWKRVQPYVRIEKNKYLIKAVTKIRYGKGGVMDDIKIVAPKEQDTKGG